MPKVMATTMSNSTVRAMQAIITNTSVNGALRHSSTTLWASLMFQATISSNAAIAESGSQESQGASSRMASSTTRAWITAATGDVAPARTLAAERAMAAVAVMPPKKGARMLPIPCPSSSPLEWCFLPVMPSSTTAHSKDSMAPSIAIEKAAMSSFSMVMRSQLSGCPWGPGRSQGSTKVGAKGGMP